MCADKNTFNNSVIFTLTKPTCDITGIVISTLNYQPKLIELI